LAVHLSDSHCGSTLQLSHSIRSVRFVDSSFSVDSSFIVVHPSSIRFLSHPSSDRRQQATTIDFKVHFFVCCGSSFFLC
ncbi:hypothetical protein U1Q18_032163, partial [Sarracenia purpurea var. burkii]